VSKKQKVEEHEIVILGSGLGGLIAGACLSRTNRDVLLLKERRYQPSFVREGYRFVPFSNFSERRPKHSLLQKISRALNLPPLTGDQEDGRKAYRGFGKAKQESAFQVILPKARVDLFCQRSIFRREWKREFSKETDRIANLYKEMERISPLLRRTKAEGDPCSAFPIRPSPWIKRWLPFRSLPRERMNEKLSPFSKEFREFIQLQLISWGNLYSDRFPLYLAAYLLLQAEGGEWISEIDLEGMKKRILESFALSDGKVEEIEGVEKIERKWWRGFVLSLKGETRVLRSRFLLLNSPLHHLSYLLGKKERKLSRWRKRIQPRYALLPLFLGIDEKVVPVGMRDLLVSIQDLEKPYGGGNLLLLHLGPKGDEEWAPQGKRAVTVESLISLEQWDPSSLDEHLKGVMRHLHHLFPFLEHYIEFTDWSWAKEQFLCWSYPHFLYETNHDFKWGEGVVPPRLSRNLYFVGKENFPYLGLEGEVLSGRLVAKQLLERFKS
jgi:phytoene dehydrogenase-like protein